MLRASRQNSWLQFSPLLRRAGRPSTAQELHKRLLHLPLSELSIQYVPIRIPSPSPDHPYPDVHSPDPDLPPPRQPLRQGLYDRQLDEKTNGLREEEPHDASIPEPALDAGNGMYGVCESEVRERGHEEYGAGAEEVDSEPVNSESPILAGEDPHDW